VVTCSSCDQLNPEGARFCNACGAELAAAAAWEVRKTVTILFADVTGSTALGEQLDPESLRRVLARYFKAATGCLERHGGTVEKFIGDAVMAVFGVPTLHEDDALRALRAAAELRDSLTSLNRELERDYGISLQLRIGVNTGEVVTGTEERLATGDAVNVAARLEQAAQPGDILIGEQTCRLSRGAIEVDPAEPLLLKGKSELVRAYRLVRVIEGAPAFGRHLDAPLVGRRGELATLRTAFNAAVSGQRCRLVTVLGPPGIGKSRLANELVAMLAEEATVLTGRCLPYGEGITYLPLIEIFREAGAEEELAAALATGAPEEIFWSVRKALERLARERPIALVIEDIHWAEPTLLDLIEHLLSWTQNAPLLILCLARPELIDARPAWGGQAETLTLEPLTPAESDELMATLLSDSELPADTRARISGVAGGNPLFVEQLLAMLAEGGDPGHVPATIQALLAARLDALPAGERSLLERAAVVGLEFEWDALRELAADGLRPAGAQLATLVRRGLIRPHEVIEDAFRFRHILIRDAAYERISKALRSELHERFAGWLDGRGEEFDEVVGYHLEQAYRCLTGLGRPAERAQVLGERAAERLAVSGRRAFDRGDTRATVNLLERAAGLVAVDDPRRLSFLPSLGRALREEGQADRADAVLSEAVERGRTAGERAVVADASVALSDLRFHRPARTGVRREDVLRDIDAAIQVFEEIGDEAGLARALTYGGKVRFWAGEAAAALPDLEQAARYARDAGDRAQEAESLQYVLTAAHYGPMPVDEVLALFAELRPRIETNRRLGVAFFRSRAYLEAMQGRFEDARHSVSQANALAEEHGLHVLLDSHTRPAAGYVELLADDTAAAERELRAACEGTERFGELGYLSSIAPVLVDAVYLQGRNDEALRLSEQWRPERLTVPEDADAQVGWRRVRAKVEARRGDFDEAERLGRGAVAIASGTDFLDLRAHATADLGEVLRLAGRAQESAGALEEAIRLYEEKGNVVAAGKLRRLLAGPPIEV
jgi:class 3 adenylate cyclase/tetratricopeptide (TPR) repeat protein